jgi:hypothetical protein
MTTGELNRLEREVEEARNRLTADIDRLRAPDTISSFKNDLVSEARDSRDEWIGKTKDAATLIRGGQKSCGGESGCHCRHRGRTAVESGASSADHVTRLDQ